MPCIALSLDIAVWQLSLPPSDSELLPISVADLAGIFIKLSAFPFHFEVLGVHWQGLDTQKL